MTEIDKKNKSMSKVPNLRFPEFEGEWERKKLGELSQLITKGTTPKRFTDQGVRYVKIESFNENSIDIEKCVFIDEFTHNKELKRSILKEGDILFAIAGATIGKTNIVTKAILPANTNQALAIVRLNQKENKNFIIQILKSLIMQKYIKESISVGAQPNLNLEQMNNFSFCYPNFDEQTKIASFLSLVDERIQTQNKIIEQFETLIKGLSEKLFSQKIRFKGFIDEWELKSLGELMSIPDKIKAINIDRDKLLTVKLHLKGVLKNDNTDTLSLGATNYFIRKKGQFIYGKQNLFNGAFDIIPDKFDGFLSSGDVPTLDINHSKINASYLLHFLSRETFYKRLEDVATGSGSKRIHEKTFLGVKVELPSKKEQTAIAQFLSSIDQKLQTEKDVLEQLEKQKKFLLQNLFV